MIRPSAPGWRTPVIAGVIIVVLAVAALVYGGAFDTHSGPDTAVASVAPVASAQVLSAPVASVPGSASVAASGAAVQGSDVAVILPDAAQTDAAGAAAGNNVLAALPTGSSHLVGAGPGNPASAATTSLSSLVAKVSGKPPVEHRHVVQRRASRGDSDVALLTALITHVQKGGPDAWQKAADQGPNEDLQGVEMQSCPRANTKAGLACRARICKGHVGQSPSCPAPAGKN